MTPFLGGVLLLAACGGLAQGAVIELDDNSFYNYAKDRDVLLVDFYAPWCSDCKNLEPDFQAAAVSLGARSIDLAKVDCFGAGKGLCSKYGIKQWPTLKNFNRGTYTGDYTGGLSAGEIAGYVNTVENSASPQVVSNPYAAPYTPMVMQTQQCVTRCKISKITNKAPCYAKCKAPKPGVRKMLPQPVINEKSCAKCRQPQIAGKFKRGHKPHHRVKRRIPRGDSGLPITKERRLLDIYVNKHLKGYIDVLPKLDDYTKDDKKSQILLPDRAETGNEDKKTQKDEEEKRSSIPKPEDVNRNSIEKVDIKRVKWYSSSMDINKSSNERRVNEESLPNEIYMKPEEHSSEQGRSENQWDKKKRSGLSEHARGDESTGFQPRPVDDDEEFHNKVDQLK